MKVEDKMDRVLESFEPWKTAEIAILEQERGTK
jgi:hypothetical protein